MRITAIYPTQMGGHVFHAGDTLDYSGEITPRIAANFRAEDGSPLVKAKGSPAPALPAKAPDAEKEQTEKTAKAYGVEGLRAALDEAHIAYSPKMTARQLAELLLKSRGALN